METRGHGGSCCGYVHTYNMDGATVAQLDVAIRNHFVEGNNNRAMEIILSERQVMAERRPGHPAANRWAPCVAAAGGWPAVLAARGFALTEAFRNSNSSQRVYRFTKLTERLPLDRDLPFQWTGTIITPQAAPAVTAAPQVQGGNVAAAWTHTYRHPFDTIHRLHNRRFRLERRADATAYGVFENLPDVTSCSFARLSPIPVAVAPVAVNRRPQVGDRIRSEAGGMQGHEGTVTEINVPGFRNDPVVRADFDDRGNIRGNQAYLVYERQVTVLAPQVAVPPAPAVEVRPPARPTVRATEYYATLREQGRRGPFDSIADSRRAYPRCVRFERRQIMTDGSSVWADAT